MRIEVRGIPAPQGSKKLVGRDGKGRGILVESSAKVKPWRQAVQYAAFDARQREKPLTGPLHVRMDFVLPKPKSAPKRKRTYPATRPDLSKLVRSTEDALTDAGVWLDDAQVVGITASKSYPNEPVSEECLTLDSPGCVIQIWRVEA